MIQLYVPAVLDLQIRRYHEEHHLTLAQLVLRAITATHDQLADLSNRKFRPAAAQAGLFSGDVDPFVSVPARQVGVRLLTSDITVIDQLADAAGARSRSSYILFALDLFLSRPRSGGGQGR